MKNDPKKKLEGERERKNSKKKKKIVQISQKNFKK